MTQQSVIRIPIIFGQNFCRAINIAHFSLAFGLKKVVYIVRKIINNETSGKQKQFYLSPCACYCYLKAICKQFPATALKLPFVPKYHQIWWYICKILKLSVTYVWNSQRMRNPWGIIRRSTCSILQTPPLIFRSW